MSATSWQPGRRGAESGPPNSQFDQVEGASECLPFWNPYHSQMRENEKKFRVYSSFKKLLKTSQSLFRRGERETERDRVSETEKHTQRETERQRERHTKR